MTDETQLFDVAGLTLVGADTAPPGSLLLRGLSSAGEPCLAFADPGDDPQRPYQLSLTGEGRDAFCAHGAGGGRWLAIARWRVLVDPSTAFLGTSGMPMPGDAFISGGQLGFIGRMNHAEIYVSAAGALLREPDWSQSFVAFRRWQIVVDGLTPETVRVLLQRDRAVPSRPN